MCGDAAGGWTQQPFSDASNLATTVSLYQFEYANQSIPPTPHIIILLTSYLPL